MNSDRIFFIGTNMGDLNKGFDDVPFAHAVQLGVNCRPDLGYVGRIMTIDLNEILLLSTGEVAQVVEINRVHLSRPRVRVIRDAHGRLTEDGREIDLSADSSVTIAEVQTADILANGRGE